MLKDRYSRVIKDLRISVTDRCNYHCFYCKPLHGRRVKYRAGLMTYEEITRIARLFVDLGVEKIRITGGEPMLRRQLETLIRSLAALDGLRDLAMTTNAHFLTEERAYQLRDAGLHRLTISLDSLRRKRFQEMTRQDALPRVLAGIQAAERAGFSPLKINVVVIRNVNEDEILDFAQFSRETGNIVRFIEFMPLDADQEWSHARVFPQTDILAKLQEVGKLVPLGRNSLSETANRFGFEDGRGEIGIIASVSNAFCGQCSRMRLTADGKLRPCLFSNVEYDLLERLRGGQTDQEIVEYIRHVTYRKEAGHRINDPNYTYPQRSMSFIGG